MIDLGNDRTNFHFFDLDETGTPIGEWERSNRPFTLSGKLTPFGFDYQELDPITKKVSIGRWGRDIPFGKYWEIGSNTLTDIVK